MLIQYCLSVLIFCCCCIIWAAELSYVGMALSYREGT